MSRFVQVFQFLAVLCAVCALCSAYYHPMSRSVMGQKRQECSRNSKCLWAICRWSQRVLIDGDNCMFVPSGCVCPKNTRCERTIDYMPDNGYVTIPFTCQYA